MSEELTSLLAKRNYDLAPWINGKVPKHYKRLSVIPSKARELAELGAHEMFKFFGVRLFFSQALIAGAILSNEYDEFVIVTPPQYGKSWLFGRLAVLRAWQGRPVYIAGASQDLASIIMQNAIAGLQDASAEIRNSLINKKDQLDRLATSVSKTRVAFSSGGSLEAISLADTYQDSLARNKALGKGGDFFADEASLISDKALSEMGRREFARTDNKSYQLAMISNPHEPGTFYEKLTEEKLPERRFVLWMDVLTAIEEERLAQERVINSDWDKNIHDRRRYLLCELDVDADTMLQTPKVYEGNYEYEYAQYFIGLDSAYKGKDNITVALNAVDDEGMCHIDEVHVIDKGDWIDGVTEDRIIDDIAKIARYFRVPLVCADQGSGVWLVKGLNDRGIACKGVNFGSKPTRERVKANEYSATNASNLRAEMHLDLQNLIEDGGIEFSESAWEKVKDVFPFIKSERKANGKIQVIKKSEIKAKIGKSPDELDAVLLSIYAPLLFRTI